MATKNTEATRYYSDIQEKAVCKLLGGKQTPNSGAGHFCKSDVVVKEASLGIECKTCTSEKSSFSIKKEWLEKSKEEGFQNRLCNSAIAFNFGPNTPNFFVIDSKLMRYLVEKLIEDGESS